MSIPFRAKSTLEQWRIFQAVVDYGGYAQAASQLNKSQSSLNHAVSKLQNLLGIQLLEVKGRKAYLTPMGEVMLRRSKLLSQNIQELELLAASLEQGWEPQLSLACEIIQPRAPIIKALKAFLPESRGTRVEVIDTVITGADEAITDGKTDLVITGLLPKGVLGERLSSVTLVPVIHRSHPLAKMPQPVSIDEVLQHVQLVVRDTGKNPQPDRGWLRAEQRWTFSGFNQVLEVLNQGLGFAWLPEHVAKPFFEDDSLVELNIQGGASKTLNTYLVIPRPEQLGPAGQYFSKLLLQHCKAAR
ncbi:MULTISPECIES: LysR family transcriptional regulator [unclassified Agarivorans]|uniref:LysR family transcriptional regulator n=1 Tax=unclassified Agarivorans TaxID=2636026 RepID=UPI0026E33ED2|nr:MULTISPECIES: LysR family transcriptional regulator [unclassified Agarivorans]MDO6685033.1 LysR family transcriptional regulator [Agarivorans sp. 3_MG-2023]MDO6717409.1 LysR family transcriptional regulator [Agarivorans sp. 2_MG-2023]MDO6765318.1 LysR family transcriptional regulator [Agarivorans sp. 1_MG-2023]